MERYFAPQLLTMSSKHPQPIRNGIVEVDAGRVRWVGPAASAPTYDGPQQIAEHHLDGLLMPGLINSHAHTPMVLLRGLGEGLAVDQWLQVLWKEEAKLTPELVEVGMLAGGAELLRSGITTSLEMYFYPDRLAAATTELGMRAVITPPMLAEMTLPGLETWEQQWEQFLGFSAKWGDHDQIQVGMGPHAAYSVSDQALRTISEHCAANRMLVHIHLSEQEWEDDPIRERSGLSATEYLNEVGMWEALALAAHGIWLSDDDITILAKKEVSVAHCPCSNTKHASGIIRLNELMTAGINLTIATDGPASHHRLDLFEEMRTAIRLARIQRMDAQYLSAQQALATVTTNPAQALGRADLGRLEIGSWADMVNINLNHPSFHPHTEPYDVISRLVWSGSPESVENVWVGGEQVVSAGRLTQVDNQELTDRLTGASRQLLSG